MVPESAISWKPCFRIVAARYPSINFFESVAPDPTDWEFLLEVERLTDPSFDVGDLTTLAHQDRLSGPGYGRIIPSFTFFDPVGTRFSDGTFGAYYAAKDLKTSIIETAYHRTLFMKATSEDPQDLDQILILADLRGKLHDIRNMQKDLPPVYDLSDYTASQTLARDLRAGGSLGIVYASVRNPGGDCVAVWRPRILTNGREGKHFAFRWDGKKITGSFEKSDHQPLL